MRLITWWYDMDERRFWFINKVKASSNRGKFCFLAILFLCYDLQVFYSFTLFTNDGLALDPQTKQQHVFEIVCLKIGQNTVMGETTS